MVFFLDYTEPSFVPGTTLAKRKLGKSDDDTMRKRDVLWLNNTPPSRRFGRQRLSANLDYFRRPPNGSKHVGYEPTWLPWLQPIRPLMNGKHGRYLWPTDWTR